jgi:hypothetical protein
MGPPGQPAGPIEQAGPPKHLLGDLGVGPDAQPGPPRSQLQENGVGEILPNQISVPDREKAETWASVPWYKDKDRLGMMLAAASNGFGNMTLRGNSGLRGVNDMLMKTGMEKIEENKTMKYLAENNPEMFRVMTKIPPGQRGDYMKLAMQSKFADSKESAFAEKVRMTMQANPGMSQSEAIESVNSSGGTNINMDMGGGAKPFEAKLGEKAADWIGGRRIISGQNRAEASRVVNKLQEAVANGETITGDLISYFPETARNLFGAEGLELQQDVERVVQQSLKETLGAQFAQKEAEQLFARTWNPKASPEVNLRRVQRLLQELDDYAVNMDAIASGMIDSGGNIMGYLKDNPELASAYTANSIYQIQYEDPYEVTLDGDGWGIKPDA